MVLPQIILDNLPRLELASTGPVFTMLELSNTMPEPAIATIRELDIVAGAQRIDAKFSRAKYEIQISDYGDINEVIRRLHNNRIRPTQSGVVKRPFASQLSLQNRKYCYVIFMLRNKNWQFSHDFDPVSLGPDSIQPEAYYSPRKVDEFGEIAPRYTEVMGSRICLFIADGPTAHGGARSYSDSFNFHLELIDRDSGGQPSLIPLVIDPDVRYPGGSGVDGDP